MSKQSNQKEKISMAVPDWFKINRTYCKGGKQKIPLQWVSDRFFSVAPNQFDFSIPEHIFVPNFILSSNFEQFLCSAPKFNSDLHLGFAFRTTISEVFRRTGSHFSNSSCELGQCLVHPLLNTTKFYIHNIHKAKYL